MNARNFRVVGVSTGATDSLPFQQAPETNSKQRRPVRARHKLSLVGEFFRYRSSYRLSNALHYRAIHPAGHRWASGSRNPPCIEASRNQSTDLLHPCAMNSNDSRVQSAHAPAWFGFRR